MNVNVCMYIFAHQKPYNTKNEDKYMAKQRKITSVGTMSH